MLDFPVENLSAEDVERLRGIYEPLTQSVRELIDATIRTEMDAEAVAAAKAEIDAATARLRDTPTRRARSACASAATATRCPGATS